MTRPASLLFFLILINHLNSYCQQTTYQRSIGTDERELVTCMDPTNDGGMILGGRTIINPTMSDAFLLKMDLTGEFQ